MHNVFHHTDPNQIAPIILETLNQIIDTLAPMRIVPVKKDNIPYIDSETRKDIKLNKKQLTEAILAKNDKHKWRKYRKLRNNIFKTISKNKASYIKRKLAKPIDKWRFVKSMNSNLAPSTQLFNNPNGYVFQSPKLIQI